MNWQGYKKEDQLFASALRLKAALASSAVVDTTRAKNVTFVVKITAQVGTSSKFTVEGYDPGSNTWVTLLASAAQTGAGTVFLTVGEDTPIVANLSANLVLPSRIRITPAENTSLTSVTFSIGVIFN